MNEYSLNGKRMTVLWTYILNWMLFYHYSIRANSTEVLLSWNLWIVIATELGINTLLKSIIKTDQQTLDSGGMLDIWILRWD